MIYPWLKASSSAELVTTSQRQRAARVGVVALLMAVLAACASPMTVDEFCELSRQGDLETARLFTTTPGTDEFDAQLQVVGGINDRLFANPPEAIAPVAKELAPMLRVQGADNDRVTELLDQVGDFVAQNCQLP